jgi:hypothetical protein
MRQHPVVADTLRNDGGATRMEFGSITETRQIEQNAVLGQVDSQAARELKIGRRVIAREALQRRLVENDEKKETSFAAA